MTYDKKTKRGNSTYSIYGDKILYEVYPIEKVEGVEEIDANTSTDNRIPHSDFFLQTEEPRNYGKIHNYGEIHFYGESGI